MLPAKPFWSQKPVDPHPGNASHPAQAAPRSVAACRRTAAGSDTSPHSSLRRRIRRCTCPRSGCAEIACAAERGRIEIDRHGRLWFRHYVELNGWTVLPIELESVEEAYALPAPFHRDPADRNHRLGGPEAVCFRRDGRRTDPELSSREARVGHATARLNAPLNAFGDLTQDERHTHDTDDSGRDLLGVTSRNGEKS